MEAIGLTSGLLALTSFAIDSSKTLFEVFESIKNQGRSVRDLKQELEALRGVLQSLNDTLADPDIDLSVLEIPLLRCGQACEEFARTISKCTSRSNDNKHSIRDWVRLTYHGKNISEFRNLIAAYKSTLAIALADANIRHLKVTNKLLHEYREMIDNTTSDLEEILQKTVPSTTASSTLEGTDAQSEVADRLSIEAERASLEQCLNICRRVLEHIDGVQIELFRGDNESSDRSASSATPDKPSQARLITRERLNDCKVGISVTRAELQARLQEADHKLSKLSRGLSKFNQDSNEDKLQDESITEDLDSIRQCLFICANASEQAERTNVFEDVSLADDGYQIVVATLGDLISAKRVIAGTRSRQILGQMSDESLQHLSRHAAYGEARRTNAASASTGQENQPDDDNRPARGGGNASRFATRHGTGRKLT